MITHIRRNKTGPRGIARVAKGGSLLLCMFAAVATAAPPHDALPVPYYTFDRQSPKVLDGSLHADSILELDFPLPREVVLGDQIGLGSIVEPFDEIDALSSAGSGLGPADQFSLLFSVDRATNGVASPDSTLFNLGVPYNAWDQANRGQGAGDQYMSTVLCTRSTGCELEGRALTYNSALIRNNYDEGGTDFNADPPGSAEEQIRAPQDNVNSTAYLQVEAVSGDILNVYFSVAADSPSLPALSLPNAPSGANIFFNEHPAGTGVETVVFASHTQLGLAAANDIDAMIVVDADENRIFDGADQVFFSLAPGSNLFTLIPGTGPADVFVAAPGEPVELYLSASELGLGEATDNLDALDVSPCDDAAACATAHGIRRPEIPAVSDVGMVVMLALIIGVGGYITTRRSPATD